LGSDRRIKKGGADPHDKSRHDSLGDEIYARAGEIESLKVTIHVIGKYHAVEQDFADIQY
jgi:hypothetical protein